MVRQVDVGDIVVARFPEHMPPRHEQQGIRPALVVGVPERCGRPRFPVIFVAPLTTDRGQAWVDPGAGLYPRLAAGVGGLPSPSVVLLDQLRSLSAERVLSWLGSLDSDTWRPIHACLLRILVPDAQVPELADGGADRL